MVTAEHFFGVRVVVMCEPQCKQRQILHIASIGFARASLGPRLHHVAVRKLDVLCIGKPMARCWQRSQESGTSRIALSLHVLLCSFPNQSVSGALLPILTCLHCPSRLLILGQRNARRNACVAAPNPSARAFLLQRKSPLWGLTLSYLVALHTSAMFHIFSH